MTDPTSSITPKAAETVAETAADTVDRFLGALGRYDFDELGSCLAPNVWFRALLPKSLHESSTSEEAAEAYRSWYGSAKSYKALSLEHSIISGREYLRYRFLVLPPWAPDEWHVIEQTGFCRVKEGRISRLDIVCTGFHPAREKPASRSSRPPHNPDLLLAGLPRPLTRKAAEAGLRVGPAEPPTLGESPIRM